LRIAPAGWTISCIRSCHAGQDAGTSKVADAFNDHLEHLGGTHMRSMLFVLAALVASGPAAAQSWKEYAYSEYAVSLTFPANPQIEMTSYQVAEGRSVPARAYSVRQDKMAFNLTIADLAGTNFEESALIDNAIKTLSTGGELTLNLPHRIYRVYGRQFVVKGRDGSTSMAAVFEYKGRLYLIEAKALPGSMAADSEFALTRFQQSLTFTDGGSNRTEDQIRAYREACPRSAGGGGNAAGRRFNPAGLDDPRCQAQ
jgi:hypothetical protein